MRTEQLYYAIAVAETGSYYKAAERLYISHQSLRKAIKTLEQELGTELFHPTSKGVALTAKGKLYLKQFHTFIAMYENLKEETFIKNFLHEQKTFRLGLNTFARTLLYSHYHDLFSARFPNLCTLVTESDVTSSLLGKLISKTLDLAICAVQLHCAGDDPTVAAYLKSQSIKFVPLLKVTISAMVQPGHPLLAKADLDAVDLLDYPIVDDSSDLIASFLKKSTNSHAHIENVATTDMALIRTYITEQNAICFGAASALSDTLSDYGDIALVTLPVDILTSDLGAFYLDDDSPKLLIALEYIQFLQEKLSTEGISPPQAAM